MKILLSQNLPIITITLAKTRKILQQDFDQDAAGGLVRRGNQTIKFVYAKFPAVYHIASAIYHFNCIKYA